MSLKSDHRHLNEKELCERLIVHQNSIGFFAKKRVNFVHMGLYPRKGDFVPTNIYEFCTHSVPIFTIFFFLRCLRAREN